MVRAMLYGRIVVVVLCVHFWHSGDGQRPSATSLNTDEASGQKFLSDAEDGYSNACNKWKTVEWAYMTNITPVTQAAMVAGRDDYQKYLKQKQTLAQQYANTNFADEAVKRQLTAAQVYGPSNTSDSDLTKMNNLEADVKTTYNSAKLCSYTDKTTCNLTLIPDVQQIMASTTDPDGLKYYWTQLQDIGEKLRESYPTIVDMSNKVAAANNLKDTGTSWLLPYGENVEGFRSSLDNVFSEVQYLYRQLFTYVRKQLRSKYKDVSLGDCDKLPVYLLGSLWADRWTGIEEWSRPFPKAPSLTQVSSEMNGKGYSIDGMVSEVSKLFSTMGLDAFTSAFAKNSLFDRPNNTDIVCSPSAEDFCLGKSNGDYRVKMCARVTLEDYLTMYTEMGKVSYFMAYQNLPYFLRNAANPGFLEAVGDVVALSAFTPTHLQCNLTLLNDASNSCATSDDPDSNVNSPMDINYLYYMALRKVAFLPYAYTLDKWRWDVFSGKNTPNNATSWWEMREKYQGVTAADKKKFDPGTHYSIVANTPYIQNFVGTVLQFQLYEAICKKTGEYVADGPKPLHRCDFTKFTKAGEMLQSMMKSGFSKPWQTVLQEFTGSSELSADALLKYFQPLLAHLENENAMEYVGWDGSSQECVSYKYMSKEYHRTVMDLNNKQTMAGWDFETHLNSSAKENSSLKALAVLADFQSRQWRTINSTQWSTFQDKHLARQFFLLKTLGTAALDTVDLTKYNSDVTRMTAIYGSAAICPYAKKDKCKEKDKIRLEPDIETRMAKSRDIQELNYLWEEWRDATGRQVRSTYKEYVDLANKAAKKNGYDSMGDMWLFHFESDTFREDMEKQWQTVRPLYLKLHAYVRHKLRSTYDIGDRSPIPANVLGNMWGQEWQAVLDLVKPYPDVKSVDITSLMVQRKWNVTHMFRVAEDFFISVGLDEMPALFWDRSILDDTQGLNMVCHASAWDMYSLTENDYRIKMCTAVDQNDLMTIHHEMGHVQYFLQYQHQPYPFRDGANPGFHEAIGDVIALSASNPVHLKTMGFLPKNYSFSEKAQIQFLLETALTKIAFLPFGYLVDLWRWNVFNGTYPEEKWNYAWWQLRENYQGIKAPVFRSEKDLDPAAKFHVVSDTQYISYFFSYILQFQLHKGLCSIENASTPLHLCDIYNSKKAGERLKHLLRYGASKPWQDVLDEIIGNRSLDASALLEYFRPLEKFLDEQIAANKLSVGWDSQVDTYMATDPADSTESPSTTTTQSAVPDQTVPIAVGAVLAVLVVIVLVVYVIGRRRRLRMDRQRAMDNVQN